MVVDKKNRVVEKQDLCEWTSKALKVALTPNNVIARFRKMRIRPLNCLEGRGAMGATVGFKEIPCAR